MIATMSGFDGRVERSRLEIFCQPGRRVDHPILPRAARICPARGERHFEADPQKVQRIDTPREKCLFCGGKHPSVLAFVDRRMETVIPDEEGSFTGVGPMMRSIRYASTSPRTQSRKRQRCWDGA